MEFLLFFHLSYKLCLSKVGQHTPLSGYRQNTTHIDTVNVIMGQHGIYQLQVVYVIPVLDTVCTKWYCGAVVSSVASQQHSPSMHVFVFAPTGSLLRLD